MLESLTIDENGGSGVGAAEVHDLGGRVAPTATSVVIELVDGRSVTASLEQRLLAGLVARLGPGRSGSSRPMAPVSEVASVEVPA